MTIKIFMDLESCSIDTDQQKFGHKIMNIFLSINYNI